MFNPRTRSSVGTRQMMNSSPYGQSSTQYQGSGGGQQGQQPPQGGNPLAQSYNAWSEKTPFLTRIIAIITVVLYILSWFIPLDLLFSNIPRYTLYRFEIYRLILSPLVGNSLLTLILGLFMFVPSGSRFESSIGSAAFGALLLTITLSVNLLFLASCFLLYAAGINGALYWGCSDLWLWVFALMSIECFREPEAPRRMLFIPVEIPSKYMPLIFYGLIVLFNGVELGYGYSILLGYLAVKGHLDRLRPSSYFLVSQESSEGWLHRVSRQRGYVLAGSMGHDSWIPLSQAEGGTDSEMGYASSHSQHSGSGERGNISGFSAFSGSGNTLGGGGTSTAVPSAPPAPRDQFPGSGHKLSSDSSGGFPAPGVTVSPFYVGTVAPPSTAGGAGPSREEIAARRLAALEASKR